MRQLMCRVEAQGGARHKGFQAPFDINLSKQVLDCSFFPRVFYSPAPPFAPPTVVSAPRFCRVITTSGVWQPAAFNLSQSVDGRVLGTVSFFLSLLSLQETDQKKKNREEWNMFVTFSRTGSERTGCPARNHFRKRKPLVRLIQKRRREGGK